MKKILSFVMSVAMVLTLAVAASAEQSIKLDADKIKLLEEYAMRIPYFYGDDVNSPEFAQKTLVFIYNGWAYRSGLKNGYVKVMPIIGMSRVVDEVDVNNEYKLIFDSDIPKDTKISGTCIGWEAHCYYDDEYTKDEYTRKYIIQTGDCPGDLYEYKNAIDDGNGGLYVSVECKERSDGTIYNTSILHIVPAYNKNGFALVSHTPYMPERNIQIKVNGRQLDCSHKPMMLNDTVYVPMRAIFEAFNSTVAYDRFGNLKHIITATNSEGVMQLKYDINVDRNFNHGSQWNLYYTAKDDICRSECYYGFAPIMMYGTTFVPVRVIAETLGADVSWDGATKTVLINGSIPDKWSKDSDIDKMNTLSYEDIYAIVKGYCDKNEIVVKGAQDIWDVEHGKGIVVGGVEDNTECGLIYYFDGSIEKREPIAYSYAQQLAKKIMETENLTENIKTSNNFMWDWDTYNNSQNGEYLSESDTAYLIEYYGGSYWHAYSVNKYTEQICDVGGHQDISPNAISGFYIER